MSAQDGTLAWAIVEPGSADRLVRFAHEAMNTVFEVIVSGQDPPYAEQAAWAAFHQLDQIETELSRFLEGSDIWRINSLRGGESTVVGTETMECLQLARRVFDETDGAFDVTAGGAARGMNGLTLDEKEFTVAVESDGLVVDLGGIGKGWALDRMAAVLREWQVGRALIHGGRSSAYALGAPGATEGWAVAIGHRSGPGGFCETIALRDCALSGSADVASRRHILDPRTGRPAEGEVAAWALAPSAALADALSTAFVVMKPSEIERYCSAHAGCDYRRWEGS